ISGYCATGIAKSESRPAIVVTSAMTMARRGLSTKTEVNIGSAPAGRRGHGRGEDRRSRPEILQPLDDDLLVAGQTLFDDDIGTGLGADLNALHHGLAVLDREDIGALLIGDQRRLRNQHLLLALSSLDGESHKRAVDE